MNAAQPRPASSASSPLTILAFDFGTRRIGVAMGSTVLRQARPLTTLAHGGTPPWDDIGRLIAEWEAGALVVGVPLHPDGAEHEMTHKARRFARQLGGRYRLPVHEVDERYSSVEAQAGGASPGNLDAAAAAIILDQFFANTSPS